MNTWDVVTNDKKKINFKVFPVTYPVTVARKDTRIHVWYNREGSQDVCPHTDSANMFLDFPSFQKAYSVFLKLQSPEDLGLCKHGDITSTLVESTPKVELHAPLQCALPEELRDLEDADDTELYVSSFSLRQSIMAAAVAAAFVAAMLLL